MAEHAPVLAPDVPQHVADLFETGEIEWQTGWGDRDKHTCLHGALLRPCAIPGDEIMWSALLSYRGLTIDWNDEQRSVEPIVGRLREQADPDEDEMVKMFGPNWRQARWVARTWSTATDEQRQAAWAAWAARAAWTARAAWAAWAARAAWTAWTAFCAALAEPWIGTPVEWTREAYETLIGPFVQVFGPIPTNDTLIQMEAEVQ